jgi:glycosyltransferase involved in cell wall biosynthesis
MKKLRIGFISTRLNGTDGVSLEVEKLSRVLRRLGHEVFYCAGELGGYAADGALIPELHFAAPAVHSFHERAFGPNAEMHGKQLEEDVLHYADLLRGPLLDFIRHNHLDVLFIQNALAIPMNLPLGVCLSALINELRIHTLAHHHDFYWERARFQVSSILDLLDTYFPPDLPTIQHITINTIAQNRLKIRRGIESTVIPNVHDFATPPPAIDDYNRDFRQALGLRSGERFILQPTRVIQRKGIELAIEFARRLELPGPRLYITHSAGDEGTGYWNWLKREAQQMGVQLLLVDDLVGAERAFANGRKVYSLWDAYPFADLVTYPSLYEGFGNALLEAIYFRRLTVVNRYPVYNADIRPLGFDFIELDGYVDEGAVQKARLLLDRPEQVSAMTAKNYRLAQEHFSLEVLEKKLAGILSNF